ncbi:MAG: relaxase domain-containing protein, partial [Pseudomonadota bacterium]|nr:relaxase domain-containing protein [Pseudomonadota bacterium]
MRIAELQDRLNQAERNGLLGRIDGVAEWRREFAQLELERDRILGAFREALGAASYRCEKVLEAAAAGIHGHTAAEPRRDMHPRLAALLALDPNRPPSRDEIANLLNGQRADGEDIPGKQTQRATMSLADALGLDPERAPMWDEVSHILGCRRADGKPVEGVGTGTARGRFLALLGAKSKELEPGHERNLLAGCRADGSDIELRAYAAGVTASKARIGYVDLTFSADKSLSVAWAFAPTEAERNILAQVHRDAVGSAMEYIAAEMGQVRKGKAGKHGTEPGHIGWLMFDHCTSRPTVEIARADAQGRAYTELLTLKAAGDPQLHTHVAVPNVVLTGVGRVSAMDLDKLQGRIHEFGGYYQAHVATNLRRHGVEVVLEERTGAARLTAIPGHVRDAFSKRTRNGTEAAREYAADLGLDWDALSPERKAGLVKEGTQTHKLAKATGMSAEARAAFEGAARKDDKGDFAAWKRQAAALRWSHRSVLRPDAIAPTPSRDERLEHAYQTALPLLDQALQRRAKVDGQDLRVVAARSLVASGVAGPQDIGAITRAFATRGVRQDGRDTVLVWGEDVPVRGKARVGVTTSLHESQERELIALARAAGADRSAALSRGAIGHAVRCREEMPLEGGGLRFQGAHGEAQREVMDQLGQGGRFSVAIGVAGAGKSALLAPLVDAWRADGRQV